MKFFKQHDSHSCQIVAIKTVLSFFDIYENTKQISSALPKHSFGNLITEVGIFFERKGIKTKLFANTESLTTTNELMLKTLEEYQKIGGKFEVRIPTLQDVRNTPVLINIDWAKVKSLQYEPEGHYVVILKEDGSIYLYDGINYKRKVKKAFKEILSYSKDINRSHDDGMWLVFL